MTMGIKGTLFFGVVDDVNLALSSGALSQEKLEARLESSDLQLLEGKPSASSWYDIFAYHRIVEVLASVHPLEAHQYWMERGRRASRRLLDMGIYQQLDYLGRIEAQRKENAADRFHAFGRVMRLLITIQAALVNFGDWSCVADQEHERRYRIEIRNVEGVPDGLFLATAGFLNGFSEYVGSRLRWKYERPAGGFVLIRMLRDM